ncbi:hypothetical protein SNE40_009542 [Patella caerulea]|uniref:Uncharacterized protein n=1 Tax=Patella caerulea TaxID=87958 RepID=A0AAN8PQD7_PATCE
MKLIKTCQRNRLKNDVMQSIFQINLNGPQLFSDDAGILVNKSVKTWLAAKHRRKLPQASHISSTNNQELKSCINELNPNSEFNDIVAMEYDDDDDDDLCI